MHLLIFHLPSAVKLNRLLTCAPEYPFRTLRVKIKVSYQFKQKPTDDTKRLLILYPFVRVELCYKNMATEKAAVTSNYQVSFSLL